MPETLVGSGNFFALIAKGESMIDVGFHTGDYVVVNKDKQPKLGDIVVALLGEKNNLKVLGYNEKKKQYVLESRNSDKAKYADIPVDGELTVQGVAVCVTHKF